MQAIRFAFITISFLLMAISAPAQENETDFVSPRTGTLFDYSVHWTAGSSTDSYQVDDLIRFLEAPLKETLTIDIPGLAVGARPLRLVRIPAGTFQMGSPVSERGREPNEGPQHLVMIPQDFYLGETAITQAQWRAVLGYNPATTYGVGDDYPVYFVSWEDCQLFIAELERLVGGDFRLPSEAEWEYACRARTGTRFYFGDSLGCDDVCENCAAGTLSGNRSDYMWYCGNETSNEESHPVKQKTANGFGLYDMHGNVFEWCQDWWHSDYTGAPSDGRAWEFPTSDTRVIRGGTRRSTARYCRSATRFSSLPDYLWTVIGLRVLRSAAQ